MTNLFSLITNYLRESYQPTYGEIINESKNEDETLNNMVRNACTSEEYEQYIEIKNKDRQRLLFNSSNINTKKIVQTKPQQQTTSTFGIGECVQIC